MSIIEFKDACKIHRELCPYKSTPMTTCGKGIRIQDGKCPKDEEECYYMKTFKEALRKVAK